MAEFNLTEEQQTEEMDVFHKLQYGSSAWNLIYKENASETSMEEMQAAVNQIFEYTSDADIIGHIISFNAQAGRMWENAELRKSILSEAAKANRIRDAVGMFDSFLAKIETPAYKPIKTGLPSFDQLLGGGMNPQSIVMLGAAPGMGKTTLAQQIFETMAANGNDVVFLNFEMSREQLLARSISRLSKRNGFAISPASVMRGYSWTEEQRTAVKAAAEEYRRTTAPRMRYNPEGTAPTLSGLKTTLEYLKRAAIAEDRNAPVVVMDYLQMIQGEGKQDPAEAIKQAIKILKDYAIEGQTVAFVILATNRSSNSAGQITLESGRDTSAIEYGADVFLGLNYTAFLKKDKNPSQEELEAEQTRKPRRVSLTVLKSRMNEVGKTQEFFFDGENSVFNPIDNSREVPHGWRDVTNDNSINLPFMRI